jgi:hypothetical protein
MIRIRPVAPLLNVLRSLGGLDVPLAPFSTATGCAGALLLARLGPVTAAWWAAIARDDTMGRRWLGWAGAGFVASLAFRGLFVPFAVVAILAAARAARALAAVGAALVLAILMAALWPARMLAPDPLPATTDPVAETLEWSRRDNPFWTHYWAAQWSSRETEPGAGRLALARASWALGHHDEALRIATQLATGAPDPGTRKEAAAALAAWDLHR